MIRRGEIANQGEAGFKRFVVMELGAIVQREGMEASGVFSERSARGTGDLICRSRLEFLDHGVTGFSFEQCEDAVMLVLPDDRVAFPVPELLALLDRFAAFGNVPLARQHTSRILAVIAFAPLLRHDPHVSVQRASRFLVTQNVAIDRFMTDRALPCGTQSATDLLRAPFLAQQNIHVLPLLGTEPRSTSRGTPTRGGVRMRFLSSIVSVTSRAVAPHLSADRTGRTPQFLGDLRLREARTAQSRDAVSFLLGELMVPIHHCFLFLGGKWKLLVSQLARLFQEALHFVCESAWHNTTVKGTAEKLRFSVPPALWAPAAPYLRSYASKEQDYER